MTNPSVAISMPQSPNPPVHVKLPSVRGELSVRQVRLVENAVFRLSFSVPNRYLSNVIVIAVFEHVSEVLQVFVLSVQAAVLAL